MSASSRGFCKRSLHHSRMAALTLISLLAPRRLRTLLSPRLSPGLTRITLTRSLLPTTTHEPPPPTIPGHPTPVTAASPSPGLTPALSPLGTELISATRLSFTTARTPLGTPYFSLRAAADRESATGRPLTVARPGPLALALPIFRLAVATASLAGA